VGLSSRLKRRRTAIRRSEPPVLSEHAYMHRSWNRVDRGQGCRPRTRHFSSATLLPSLLPRLSLPFSLPRPALRCQISSTYNRQRYVESNPTSCRPMFQGGRRKVIQEDKEPLKVTRATTFLEGCEDYIAMRLFHSSQYFIYLHGVGVPATSILRDPSGIISQVYSPCI